MPWLPLFPGRVPATHHGRLILDPRKSAAAIAPEDSSLVILARACDLPAIQARLLETLSPLTLPDGLTVGRAIGAPLDMQEWPED